MIFIGASFLLAGRPQQQDIFIPLVLTIIQMMSKVKISKIGMYLIGGMNQIYS